MLLTEGLQSPLFCLKTSQGQLTARVDGSWNEEHQTGESSPIPELNRFRIIVGSMCHMTPRTVKDLSDVFTTPLFFSFFFFKRSKY